MHVHSTRSARRKEQRGKKRHASPHVPSSARRASRSKTPNISKELKVTELKEVKEFRELKELKELNELKELKSCVNSPVSSVRCLCPCPILFILQ